MSKVFRCALLDDELLALSYLRTLCESIPEIEVVKAYNDPENFLAELDGLKIDFYISDIVMPQLNGLEVAEKLNSLPVIFVSAHSEYAVGAFDLQAIDYVRKPAEKVRLEKAIQRVITHLNSGNTQPKTLILWTDKGNVLFQLNDIACISSNAIDRRDKLLLLKNGKQVTIKNQSFEELIERLPENDFCRISRGEVIALNAVKSYTSGSVELNVEQTQMTYSIGENYRKAFSASMKKYLSVQK